MIPAALVIPVLNESLFLPQLLQGIAQQIQRPAEIIFVDGGSSDGSPELIERWWRERGWKDGSFKIIANPGGLPGANRNAGVRNTGQPWIAFLDSGIEPAPDWLQALFEHAGQSGARAISGMCRFEGNGAVARAVCALSSGVGTEQPVLPASLFQRNLFLEVGYFPEHLRSAEDLLWLQQVARAGVRREICTGARVTYRHFPQTLSAAIGKWFAYEKSTTAAGVRELQQFSYLAAFAGLLVVLLVSPLWALALCGIYWVLRGVIDPIRRSRRLNWWDGVPGAFGIAVLLGPCLDLAKLCGILVSLPRVYLGKLRAP